MKIKVFLYLGLLATTAVWGGAFLVMKDSLVRQDVYSFLASRFILAAAFMFIYKPKSLTGLDRKFVKRAVLIGLLLCSGFIFQTFGLTQTTVSNTGFITGLYLVFTPLISWNSSWWTPLSNWSESYISFGIRLPDFVIRCEWGRLVWENSRNPSLWAKVDVASR